MPTAKSFIIFIIGLIFLTILAKYHIPPMVSPEMPSIMSGLLAVMLYVKTAQFPLVWRKGHWQDKLAGMAIFVVLFSLFASVALEVSGKELVRYILTTIIFGLLMPIYPREKNWRMISDLVGFYFYFALVCYVIKKGILDYFWP